MRLRVLVTGRERRERSVPLSASTLDLMAFLVLWLRFFDLRFDSGAMISVAAEWTEQFDYSSTGADINHADAGTGHSSAWSGLLLTSLKARLFGGGHARVL